MRIVFVLTRYLDLYHKNSTQLAFKEGQLDIYLSIQRTVNFTLLTQTVYKINQNLSFCSQMNIYRPVCRNFQRGVRRLPSRVAHLAAGLGATQGPQKPWGIWSKILQSSIFQVLHSNFRKVLFLKIFIKFYTN